MAARRSCRRGAGPWPTLLGVPTALPVLGRPTACSGLAYEQPLGTLPEAIRRHPDPPTGEEGKLTEGGRHDAVELLLLAVRDPVLSPLAEPPGPDGTHALNAEGRPPPPGVTALRLTLLAYWLYGP